MALILLRTSWNTNIENEVVLYTDREEEEEEEAEWIEKPHQDSLTPGARMTVVCIWAGNREQ